MNVLLLGSGGREHALGWKIAQSSQLRSLHFAPGNAGTSDLGTNVDLDPMDFEAIGEYGLKNDIKIIVVGPEAPLVAGIADFFEDHDRFGGMSIIGPNAEAAKLEGSKEFAKKFMDRHNIPTARYGSFTKTTIAKGNAFLEKLKGPYVLKADGLAGGKGVLIIEDLKEAKKALKELLINKKFGDASKKVVIEEFLKGIEVSMFAMVDGLAFKLLAEAKDYKRAGEGDTGLNSGGMGAVSPVPFVNQEFMEKVKNQIIIPTVKGLHKDGLNYKGFLFFGLMKMQGEPYVIEYNVRMGDPETEAVIPRLKSDLLHMLEGIATGTLSECDVLIDDRSCCTVMLTSKGYPEKYVKGKEMTIGKAPANSMFFHAGTKEKNGAIVTNGGRVLAVSAYGADYEKALEHAYAASEHIKYSGKTYRSDLGFDLAKKTKKA